MRRLINSLGAPYSFFTVDNSDLLLGSEEVVGNESTSQDVEVGRLLEQATTLAVNAATDKTAQCAPDPHMDDKVTNPSASLQTSGTVDWAEPTVLAGRDHSYFDTGKKDNPVFVRPLSKRSIEKVFVVGLV